MTRPVRDMAATIEDAEFMIKTGEFPDRIAERLGYRSVQALCRYLREHDRPDLNEAIIRLDRSSPAWYASHPTPFIEIARAERNKYRKRAAA